MPYVKLDCGITRSTIWMEDAETVRVWIYLLAEADSAGNVSVTIPAIARDNLIGPDRTREILTKFSSPDQDSRDPQNDGRRIVIHRDPEWRIEILNYLKYREKDYTNKDRQKAYRERHKERNGVTSVTALRNVINNGVTSVTEPLLVTQAEAEAEVLKEKHSCASDPKTDARFGVFWKAYPKKKSKGQALKSWLKIKPSEQLLETMLSAIGRAKTSVEWTKDGGMFIPHPATWLAAMGWEDETKQPEKQPWEKPLRRETA